VEFLQPLVVATVARAAGQWCRPTREMIRELTQEAFLKLCRDDFAVLRDAEARGEGALAYVRVAVANMVHDHFRAERSKKRFPTAGFFQGQLLDHLLGESRTMEAIDEEILLGEIDRVLLTKLSGTIARRDRAIFWLHHRDGLTAKAISQIPTFNLTEKGVVSTLHRLGNLVKDELLAGKGISSRST